MNTPPYDRRARILVADDDGDDQELIREALAACGIHNDIVFVNNGEELTDYLNRKGKYLKSEEYPMPAIILLDLNMPRKDGRQVLQEIKSDPELRRIPVLVLTTSKAEKDIQISYDLGVNSFIVKPVTFKELVDVMETIKKYWFGITELPFK